MQSSVFVFLPQGPWRGRLRVIPHKDPVKLAVVAAGDEVAVEVDFGVIKGHDGVAGVGAEVADEDEALE